ncbi:MAG: DEAD/DEAH box helicase family protein [Ilumatobacter sp.]|uniref:DEAD/DEAH box helicase n=1 Tax=Ilumatobacter sp. TaxID=1967498 RepID=UPI002621402C|nr:DEAD/DEAH box helicase family protein [Ilumatobacter sp.]MDJ0769703.1 DEAD/DEAH box helicase family protein [Ilumatobacter sp.]
MSSFTLRPWQRAAFDRFRAGDAADFLAVATPGAGKTTFALTCARATLAEWAAGGHRRHLIVVAPTSHLKVQWSLAAHRMGLQLDPDWAPGQGLARDVHGLVTTFQQVAMGPAAARLRGFAADGMVILDEVHHAGDERAWGDGIQQAFELAAKRLSLSGTPFRSDSARIPFVRYDVTAEGDLAHADYTYGYDDALRDGGVVRPVYFPRVDGQMEWSTPSGDVLRASFADELARDQVSARLRTALSLDGDWLPTVLTQAHDRLKQIRREQPDAGGLVIATDQDHAQGIARLLRDRLRTTADVVVSDDPTASRRIAEFADNDRPWLVAVRMVSEGVDIPRLRVGVYSTTTATELFFRQAVGRFVRWQAGRPSQKAYVYVPDDPRLRAHAFAIAEARRHVLRPPGEAAEHTGDQLDRQVPEEDALVEQLSLFSVVSSTATGVTFHAVTEDGVQHIDASHVDSTLVEHPGGFGTDRLDATRFDAEPDVPEPSFADDASLTIDLPDVPTEAGVVPWGSMSVAEQKDDLRTRNADIAKRLVDITGWNHARVQGEMNRLAGVTKVSTATIEQLDRRLRHGESWLRRLKRG